MRAKIYQWGLWISTILVIFLAAGQALTGHWVAFFLLWPAGPAFSNSFLQAMMRLASYHRVAGFIVGGLSVLVLSFSFLSKPRAYIRIFAVVGFIMTALAASGGYLYYTSGFANRWALGQMADAFVGVFGAYFIQLLFMTRASKFPWNKQVPP